MESGFSARQAYRPFYAASMAVEPAFCDGHGVRRSTHSSLSHKVSTHASYTSTNESTRNASPKNAEASKNRTAGCTLEASY